MISNEMISLIKQQVVNELHASISYSYAASICNSMNLKGFTEYLLDSSVEEKEHSDKFLKYLLDFGIIVDSFPPAEPELLPNNLVSVFSAIYDLELAITQFIFKIAKLATQENDFFTLNFIDWFVKEQRLALIEAKFLRDRIIDIADDKCALYALDHEVGEEEFFA